MRLQGMQNSNLTDNGLKQVKSTANILKNQKFDTLYTSDLERAVKTAEIINTFHHLKINMDASIRERNFGVMEGLTREQIQEKYPEIHTGYMKRKEKYQIPEGENLVTFFNRVKKGVNQIVQLHEGEKILMIAHGGVLDCIMRMIFDYPLASPRRFSIFNASINRFSIENGEWFLEEWGNISHHNTRILSLDA